MQLQTLNTLAWSSFDGSNANFWVAQFVFLITGFINNITANQIDSMGAGDSRNGLIVLALYVLVSSVSFYDDDTHTQTHTDTSVSF